jgi:hypothetical protein
MVCSLQFYDTIVGSDGSNVIEEVTNDTVSWRMKGKSESHYSVDILMKSFVMTYLLSMTRNYLSPPGFHM